MVFLGADHHGFHLKERIVVWLREWGVPFKDLGNTVLDDDDDYPDFVSKVAKEVSSHEQEAVGIVICGSGVGADIVANKYPGIRCGLGFSAAQIAAARAEDDINMLALPAEFHSYKKAKKIVEAFSKTEFDGQERHKRRIEKILRLEAKLKQK